jgi:hypothetical protein
VRCVALLPFAARLFEVHVGQESSPAWDLRNLDRWPSASEQLYVLFLLLVCLVASIRLFRVWRAAPPFKLSRQVNNTAYIRMLEAASKSLTQWILCILLVWGIFTSVASYAAWDNSLKLKEEFLRSSEIRSAFRDCSQALTRALLAALYAFLIRWHILTRIKALRD